MSTSKKGPRYRPLIFVLQSVKMVVDQLGRRNEFLGQLIGCQPLDRRNEAGIPRFLFQQGLQVAQQFGKTVRGDRQHDDIVILHDPFQIVGGNDMG
jgi:hypothetical protein